MNFCEKLHCSRTLPSSRVAWIDEDGAAVYSVCQAVCRCSKSVSSSLSWLSCVPFRAQQSSREAEGAECVSIRGRGHLEATGLEQQPQTHPGLRGQPSTCPRTTCATVVQVYLASEQCSDLFVYYCPYSYLFIHDVMRYCWRAVLRYSCQQSEANSSHWRWQSVIIVCAVCF